MTPREKVLVIDDESYIREFVSQVLSEKYQVFFAKNGPDGLKLARQIEPGVIVLDILMPGQDGIQTCRALREDPVTAEIPVLMLTALNETEKRIQAFSAGADDYVAKPFRPEELLLRVQAKMRRSKHPKSARENPAAHTLEHGDLRIDLQELKASIAGRPLEMGAIEFKILSLLIRKSGQLVGRDEVEKCVWDDAPHAERALDPHIASLRKKLKDSRSELKTVYGRGFCIALRAADA